MQTSLNSSPFPPLKPNVRYRTAMERAGFDVAFSKPSGASSFKSGSRSTSRVVSEVSQVNSSEFAPEAGANGGLNVASSNLSSHSNLANNSHSRSANSLFTTKQGTAMNSAGSVNHAFYKLNGHSDSERLLRNGSEGGANFENVKPGAGSSASASSPNLTTGAFPFTSGPALAPFTTQSNSSSSYGTPLVSDSGEQFPRIDPVELSFKQLTENSNAVDPASPPRESVTIQDNGSQETSSSSIEVPREINHVSVNFAPNAALNNALLNEPAHSPVPNIFVTESSDADCLDPVPSVLSVPSVPSVPIISINQPQEESYEDEPAANPLSLNSSLKQLESVPSVEVTTPDDYEHSPEKFPDGKLSAMEKLIAELDTMALTRDKGLSSPDQAVCQDKGLPEDLQTLNRPKQTHLKKSSAYLSHYEPQMISVPDGSLSRDQSTPVSLQSNSTPTFYNFQKDDVSPLKYRTPSPSEKIQDHSLHGNVNQAAKHESTVKYPPGQGPCRHCHEEVVGKGIYSKHDNELSGQWHRGCFKCIVCEKQFSKRVPCYILDDRPYCQLHFHYENNSICKVCDGFIEGECLENDKNERFHPACLKCYLCSGTIGQDYYVFNHEHTICNQHDIDALVENGVSPSAAGTKRSNTISKRRTKLINFF